MYANLEVRLPDGQTVYAWKLDVGVDGVRVYYDAQDGTGSYAEPNGEKVLPLDAGSLPISVAASF